MGARGEARESGIESVGVGRSYDSTDALFVFREDGSLYQGKESCLQYAIEGMLNRLCTPTSSAYMTILSYQTLYANRP